MSNKAPQTSGNNELKRQLNPMHVWAIAFGCVIGWGSFINPGKKFLNNSGVAGTAIAMILGALVMIIIAFHMPIWFPNTRRLAVSSPLPRIVLARTWHLSVGGFLLSPTLQMCQ